MTSRVLRIAALATALGACSSQPSAPVPPLVLTPDAVRLAAQATFGPTVAVVQDIEQRGAAAWIDAQLQTPPSDLGSVYRILETFEREGLVHRVHLGGGPARYELDGDDEREYLLCEGCGATKAIDPAELDDVRRHLRARFGLTVRFSRFPMAGLCSRCAGAHPPR